MKDDSSYLQKLEELMLEEYHEKSLSDNLAEAISGRLGKFLTPAFVLWLEEEARRETNSASLAVAMAAVGTRMALALVSSAATTSEQLGHFCEKFKEHIDKSTKHYQKIIEEAPTNQEEAVVNKQTYHVFVMGKSGAP